MAFFRGLRSVFRDGIAVIIGNFSGDGALKMVAGVGGIAGIELFGVFDDSGDNGMLRDGRGR